MNKLLKVFLLIFALGLLTVTQPERVDAAHWVKIFDEHNDRAPIYYLDTDSFIHNQKQELAECSFRIIYPWDYVVKQKRRCFNLQEHTAAVLPVEPYTKRQPLQFEPILPNSPMDNLFKLVQFIASLDRRGLQWEFNKDLMPHPSSLNTHNWVENEEVKGVWEDKASMVSKGRYDYGWSGFDNDMHYSKYDFAREKAALLAHWLVADGKVVVEYNYPVIIWFNLDGSRSKAADAAFEEENLILMSYFID